MASTSDDTKRRNTVPLRRLTNPSLQQHLPCPQCPLWFRFCFAFDFAVALQFWHFWQPVPAGRGLWQFRHFGNFLIEVAEGDLRKPERRNAKTQACKSNMQPVECIKAQKKFRGNIRYSARTRVFIEEKSVRIVQRMKNPAARKPASPRPDFSPSTLVAYGELQ